MHKAIFIFIFISTSTVAKQEIKEVTLLTKLECKQGKVFATIINKSQKKVDIPYGLLGVKNSFGWGSIQVFEKSKFDELMEKPSPLKMKEISLSPIKGGDESKEITLGAFEKLSYPLNLKSGFRVDGSEKYIAVLIIVLGEVVLDDSIKGYITSVSNPVTFSLAGMCEEMPRIKDDR
ncbi:hypothetical protein PA25_33850 [Pseudoalteromonas sp. A25]|uniref:hypothetical protein n=1 Tax=Pseudoalteromonas sp. A25 TaxID=116092 RepID=UPI0012610746|nr:hypothetical protein [Pseudoalteromonas sp. A25]BBN83400.1 hypothetical protein PA25_33850 [Pseudoalteromonas sp. A25]